MDSKSDSGARVSDHRFLHLIAWEARLLGWGRRTPLRIAMVLLIVAAALPCMWRAAIEPEPMSRTYSDVIFMTVRLNAGTPIHSARQTLTETSFAYILLHLSVYLVVGLSMLLLPGIAAGGVARDRRTGRLDDLIITTFSSSSIYAAKVIAAALPFFGAGVSVFVLMLSVTVLERLSSGSVVRLLMEMVLQIALISLISITCSILCRHAATARVGAYLIVWVAMPLLWYSIKILGNAYGHIYEVDAYPDRGINSQWLWTWEQFSNYRFLFQVVLGSLIAVVGVRRLFPRTRVKQQPVEAAAPAA